MDFAGIVSNAAQEVVFLLQDKLSTFALWAALWFVVQILFEFIAPLIKADVYDALGRKKYGDLSTLKGDELSKARRKVAKSGRTKAICLLFSTYVTAVALWAVLTGNSVPLTGDMYASTVISRHLCEFAVGFFIWDIFICFADRETIAFHAHAWFCFFAFLCCSRPFGQGTTCLVLLFEASTPALHVRTTMIEAELVDVYPRLFSIVQNMFALLFFLSRIALGYPALYLWATNAHAVAMAGKTHSVPTVYFMLFITIFLAGLNGFWLWGMIKMALGLGKGAKAAKAGAVADAAASASEGSTNKTKPE